MERRSFLKKITTLLLFPRRRKRRFVFFQIVELNLSSYKNLKFFRTVIGILSSELY